MGDVNLDPQANVAPEGNVAPSANPEPMPGQPEPGSVPSADPDANVGVDEKTVPLKALQEERSKKQELMAELEALKTIAGHNVLFDINGNPVQNAMPQPQQQQQQQQGVPELEKLWEDDPRKAVQVEIMAAMSWRDKMEHDVDVQTSQARTEHADFGEHEATVRQYIRSLPLEQRSKAGTVNMAYYIVKGQNAGSAIERAKAETLAKIQAGAGAQGLQPGTKAAPKEVKGTQLNSDQLKVADAMGLTAEEYASAMIPGGK
jgi:hypothetical protein